MGIRKRDMGSVIKSGFVVSIMAVLLTGCLGGKDKPATPAPVASTLGGVAAVGAPIVGGNIKVNCAAGSALTTTTLAGGTWEVTLSGHTLPCAVQVQVPGGPVYHSIATVTGVVNITPLTDLIVANLIGTDPATWFTGLNTSAAPLAAVTQTQVNNALANLRTALGATLPPLNTINPISSRFTPNPAQDPMDAMLVTLANALANGANGGMTYQTLLAAFNTATPTIPPAFSGVMTYTPPAFNIASVAPTSGAVGDTVTITGSGFDPFMLHNQVSFNGVAATVVSATTTQLVVTVPASATTGPITVRNIMANAGAGVTMNSLADFTVTGGGAGGGAGGIGCNTANYQPGAVRVPTANELTTFAGNYSGDLGTIDQNTFVFTKTGTATAVFGAAGAFTYNNQPQTVSSICMDNAVSMLYVEFGAADHVDLFSNGTFAGMVGMNVIQQPAAGGGGGGGTPVAGLMGGAIQGTALNLTATVSTFAGGIVGTVGQTGAIDGTGTAARFFSPVGIASDGTNLYVVDRANHLIRKIVIATGAVSTLAGTPPAAGVMLPVGGFADGVGTAAQFKTPNGITTDGTSLFVTDSGNHRIRKIDIATGTVSTLAGSGNFGYADGTGTAATITYPVGITTDGVNLYITDNQLNIRKIVIATGVVTTLAGSGGMGATGFVDGAGNVARFSATMKDLTTDGTNLYIADYGNNAIRKVVIATGAVSTLAGSATAGSLDGTGTAATFNLPIGITSDGTNLYVTSEGDWLVRKIVIATGAVTTLAGSISSFADGVGAAAKFKNPHGITTDGASLFVADRGNQLIRKIQ